MSNCSFFYYDTEIERLYFQEREGICAFSDRFIFSVHLPDILRDEHRRIVDFTAELSPTFVVHEPPEDLANFAGIINGWREDYGERFYLENLIGRDFPKTAACLSDIPVCLDTGHLLLRGESPAKMADVLGERIREVHLHGLAGGKDHSVFGPGEPWFIDFVPFLRSFSGIVNIELFSIEEVRQVLSALEAHGLP